MPLKIGNRFFPAEISNSQINAIVRSDTSPEVSLWEKIKAFFCSANKPEALALIRQICHPPDGTTWEAVTEKFEQLKTLTYGGYKESVQVGRDGENHACILDENGDEMLSVTVDKDTGEYTVKCQGYLKTDYLNPPGGWETELATDASEALWTDHSVTAAPQTAQSYEATWPAWEEAAPAGEAFSRESGTPDTMPRTPYPAPRTRAPRPVPAPRALYPVPAPRPHTPDNSEPAIYFNNK
ncbi:TPA: hypothetical protein ACWL6U_000460 [Morganella morganii]|nr:hypothetical protein [Morganella morganii]